MRRRQVAGFVLAALLMTGGLLSAQGTGSQFVNFEAPAHKPIVVVDVAGTDYLLLVANAPGQLGGGLRYEPTSHLPAFQAHQFLLRVPDRPAAGNGRGQADAHRRRRCTRQIYVANWLGDSITVFDLLPGTGPEPFTFQHVRTRAVADEPTGIAFLPENDSDPNTQPGGIFHELVFVTHSAAQSWSILTPTALTPVLTGLELLTPGATTFGVRDPRAIAWAPPPIGGGVYQDHMWVLNFRGGVTPKQGVPTAYDLDLWGFDNLVNAALSEMSSLPNHGGLGSTNFNMAFAPNGDLWVVGLRARNKDIEDPMTAKSEFIEAVGEPLHQAMATAETGFAVSFIARHTNVGSAATSAQLLDLNDSSKGTANPPTQASVPVTQPTDVVVYGDGNPGSTRVFTTGSSSDTLAAIEPANTGVANWAVHRIDSAHPANAFSLANPAGIMRGPRGLALKGDGIAPSANDRLYVYNRIEQSVSVVDPNFTSTASAVLSTFSLQGLVEPQRITDGRKFLYSSKLSLTGNSSCASCHIDGNTDFLAWNLADGMAVPAPGAPGGLPGNLVANADRKGPMVVQPLRGLVNFEVLDRGIQDFFFTNGPYHWRGDRGIFEHFNGAFVNLLGLPNRNLSAPNPLHHQGIDPQDMVRFRDFVFTIHYPPNPNQLWQRVYSGDIADPNNSTAGSGAQLGLKAFMTVDSDSATLDLETCTSSLPVPCDHCHSLPEGSNNRFTESLCNSQVMTCLPTPSMPIPDLPAQNLETAQLKALELKSRVLLRRQGDQMVKPRGLDVQTHEWGLIHTGEPTIGGFGADHISGFLSGFSTHLDCHTPANPSLLRDSISLFVHELDSGTAPLVGFSGSLDVGAYSARRMGLQNLIGSYEQQVEAVNVGMAIHARIDGVQRGFWFDPTNASTPYREEAQPGLPPLGPFNRVAFLDHLHNALGVDPTNLLTFHMTPLGSSRRVARVQGGLAFPLGGGSPSNLQLLPSPTNTANAIVPSITTFWANQVNALLPFMNNPVTIRQIASEVQYQLSLVNHAPNGFGLTQLRREAPRRFRVSGDGILDGAFLWLYGANPSDVVNQPPTSTPSPATNPINFALPIYPGRDGQGNLIWETNAELDSNLMLALLNGLGASSNASLAFLAPSLPTFISTTGGQNQYLIINNDLMQPMINNWYYVQVVNFTSTGLTVGNGGWQRLTIEP